MERLTNSIDYCKMQCGEKQDECFSSDKNKCYERSIYNKLREYESLEDNGLLLRLPCRPGTTVYEIVDDCDSDCSMKMMCDICNDRDLHVEPIVLASYSEIVLRMDDFNKTIFFTPEQAKKKCSEMKSN